MTIVKYVESAWGIGVRIRLDDKGALSREEVERCIREVMDGERKGEYRKNVENGWGRPRRLCRKEGVQTRTLLSLQPNIYQPRVMITCFIFGCWC